MEEAGSSVDQPLSRSLNGSITSNKRNTTVYLLHSNVKIFANAIIALSKLGDELFLRSQKRGISLKAFNKTRSAYGVFLFVDDFFSDSDTNCLSSDTAKDCRLSMKTALSMFKSAYFMEKNLVSCMISVDVFGNELRIEFQHTCDVSRSFDVNVMEKHKPFISDVRKSDLCNVVTVSASEIVAFVNEMHTGYEELMMTAQNDKVIFRNFVQLPLERPGESTCRTEITVQRSCFKRFSVQRRTEITFCMKEFKAILAFARQHACDVNLFFDRPGRPLIVAVESDAGYSAEFIIATMDNEEESDGESPGATQQPSRLVETPAEQISAQNSQMKSKALPNRLQTFFSQNDYRQEIAERGSQNSLLGGSRPLSQPLPTENSHLKRFGEEDESMVGAEFNEGQALGDHMRMDDFVLGDGMVRGVATDHTPHDVPMVSCERPAGVKKVVNVQFQHHFLGLDRRTQHQSQAATTGNPIVEPTQLPPS